MRTHVVKKAEMEKKWVTVDAEGQTLGRLASQIASVLRGKDKPTFTPNQDLGDNVIVVNAAKVKLTGNKLADKFYYHHTGYIGGIKRASAQEILDSKPERLITYAVQGMLPKNKLGKQLARNLRVYAGSEHTQEAQKPVPMAERTKTN